MLSINKSYEFGRVSAKNRSISSIVGGSPRRSRLTRRMRVSLEASRSNVNPSLFSLAKTKLSMELRMTAVLLTVGGSGRVGLT